MSAEIVLILRSLTAISLYIFLVSLVYFLWKNTFLQSTKFRESKVRPIYLENLASEEILKFHNKEIFIGIAETEHLQLDVDAVLNPHTRLFFKKGEWWIEDFQSSKETLLNNEPLLVPRTISSGDRLTYGKTVIKISFLPISDSEKL